MHIGRRIFDVLALESRARESFRPLRYRAEMVIDERDIFEAVPPQSAASFLAWGRSGVIEMSLAWMRSG